MGILHTQFSAMLGMKPRTSRMLGKRLSAGLHPHQIVVITSVLYQGSFLSQWLVKPAGFSQDFT